MGYYTEHELSVSEGHVVDYIHEVQEISGYTELFSGEVKWYSHEKDMRALSLKHPNIIFELKGIGEEYPDYWVEYYENGKMQREKAVIAFGDFDESKLT